MRKMTKMTYVNIDTTKTHRRNTVSVGVRNVVVSRGSCRHCRTVTDSVSVCEWCLVTFSLPKPLNSCSTSGGVPQTDRFKGDLRGLFFNILPKTPKNTETPKMTQSSSKTHRRNPVSVAFYTLDACRTRKFDHVFIKKWPKNTKNAQNDKNDIREYRCYQKHIVEIPSLGGLYIRD